MIRKYMTTTRMAVHGKTFNRNGNKNKQRAVLLLQNVSTLPEPDNNKTNMNYMLQYYIA